MDSSQRPTNGHEPNDDAHEPAASTRLTTALSLNSQLKSQLATAQIALLTHRRARGFAKERVEGSEDPRERERRLWERIRALRAEVEGEVGRKTVKDRVVEGLDNALLVSTHLRDASLAAESSTRQATLAALLNQRDNLSLELLRLRSDINKLAIERLKLRKKLVALNRQNATHTATLFAAQAPPASLLVSLPPPLRAYHTKLHQDTSILTTRLSILRNVFQLLVHESGVPLSLPAFTSTNVAELLRPPRPGEEAEEEEEEGMSPERLARLMLLAGDGSMDEADSPPPVKVQAEEGEGWRERLPEDVRRELEQWEREKRRDGKGGKRRRVE
ncbi:vitellogenin [Rhodotorula toruloides]|uniref:Vitellogenin n=1 Tax=Rhodotorula toruloides TaxID=5286 RepID=A0A511KPK3_RHOTO|nr:vitellogenin [Rhodotorula toruloides]